METPQRPTNARGYHRKDVYDLDTFSSVRCLAVRESDGVVPLRLYQSSLATIQSEVINIYRGQMAFLIAVMAKGDGVMDHGAHAPMVGVLCQTAMGSSSKAWIATLGGSLGAE